MFSPTRAGRAGRQHLRLGRQRVRAAVPKRVNTGDVPRGGRCGGAAAALLSDLTGGALAALLSTGVCVDVRSARCCGSELTLLAGLGCTPPGVGQLKQGHRAATRFDSRWALHRVERSPTIPLQPLAVVQARTKLSQRPWRLDDFDAFAEARTGALLLALAVRALCLLFRLP